METTSTTFDQLYIGDQFIDVRAGVTARVLQKKSLSSAYDLDGGEGEAAGTLVLAGKSFTTQFTKKSPVIKMG